MKYKVHLLAFSIAGLILAMSNLNKITAQSLSINDSTETSVELAFTTAGTNPEVIIVGNKTGTFGSPDDGTSYSVGDNLGSDTVIYAGTASPFNHTSLESGTDYYYKAWENDGSNNYTAIGSDDAQTLKYEPSYHVTDFSSTADNDQQITLSWNDAGGSVLPDAYLIKASTVGYNDISHPTDGTPEPDNTLVKNVDYGQETFTFTGLDANTTYYFKIFPYTNKGNDINYKTHTGTLPKESVSTEKSSESDIIADGGFTYPENIEYVDYQSTGITNTDLGSDAIQVGRFTIRDGGASNDADDQSTVLQD
ncbi:MAG: fibronectin type III domain-containing protein, partial [Bacteroidales bacterium]